MTVVPENWAAVVSISLSIVVIILTALQLWLHVSHARQIMVRLLAAVLSLVVIISGMDSILVHNERSVLVFMAVGIGILSSGFLVRRTFFK